MPELPEVETIKQHLRELVVGSLITEVEVLDSGTLALSTGPVLDPDGRRVGTFSSVWRREADGAWLVVFDKGCP